ncbi:hypothetical protein Clacol_009712 [Clathrus columnatus]|uniref:Major facilitator superfamily (MFS) profile domain-containing protein n=1 Tax=Clathrus columnatus TaxID=1419009 RepID=A0AAV5ALD7_9AGAM|nr:hypothetical protein Clacol_009712 [Clathrus columnatus]
MGRRGAYQTAIIFAGVGTLFCGLSPNFPTLIVSRFITGMGGGGVLTLAATVTADMFSARKRVNGHKNRLALALGTGSHFVLYYFFPMFFETVLLTSASEAERRDWKVPQGLGNGIMLHIGLVALPASVDRSAMAVAAGFASLWRNVGQVWGVAIASAIFQSILVRELKTRITGPGSEEIIYQIRHTTKLVPLPPEMQLPARDAYSIALRGCSDVPPLRYS